MDVMSATALEESEAFEAAMNAMIIYEEGECAKKASALLQRASLRADTATRWRVTPWRLDMLNAPTLAEEARKDAAEAHLLVLAIRSRAALPPELLAWLEGWGAQRHVQDAALAMFDGGSGDTLSAAATPELMEFAQRQGLSFIFGDVSPALAESAELWKDLHEREVAQSSTMMHILARASSGSFQHWGINE